MSNAAWELVFMMLVLKLPILYLARVVWYAVRAKPDRPKARGARPVEPARRPRPGRASRPRSPGGRAIRPRGPARGPRRAVAAPRWPTSAQPVRATRMP